MQHQTTNPGTNGSNPNPGAMNLKRLEDLDDFQVADGDPDIRGWAVKTSDGQQCGKVDGLLVDTSAMQVRCLDVKLDKSALRLDRDRHVLIPIGEARLDDNRDEVLLGQMTATQLAALPPYEEGQAMTSAPSPSGQGDAEQFYGNRGGARDEQRLTLSEEELQIGKRQKRAGEVDIRKTVETRHVSEKVPLMHEEVTIERQPVSARSGTDPDGISEGEIRIPLMAEEAVIEKRAVAKEEIVIKKTMVAGEQTVEADLQRERVDIKRDGEQRDVNRDGKPQRDY